VRTDIEDLCKRLARIPKLESLAISTNGVLLHEKAKALRWAGVNNVNISLDTLRQERFDHVAVRCKLEDVLRGIEAAYGIGFRSVKINTVVMKGFNDDELLEFVDFAKFFGLSLRFIEYMPFPGNAWDDVRLMTYREMREVIESRYQLSPLQRNDSLVGPAKEFRVEGTSATIGFITTMTEHFCHTCNRLRLTADGKLRNCLFAQDDMDLKQLLRFGASRDIIESAIRSTVMHKWEKRPDTQQLLRTQDRAMVAIGG
jgi:cyclic pyranopterin phosphate synthase